MDLNPEANIDFFSSSQFMPHGHCYLWKPALLWLNAGTDGLIFLSYLAISGMLVYMVLRLRTIPFNNIYLLFGIFIFACGLTHLMEIVNIWVPSYWLAGLVKLITAIASLGTAILLPSYLPKIQTLLKNTKLLHETEARLIQDIEKRKMVEMSLTSALNEAEKANQAKSEFLANISHEIRTPMNIIVGMSEIFEEGPLNAEQEKYVEIFKKAGNSLLNIINDLLDISKIESGNLTIDKSIINLRSIMREVEDLCSSKASTKGISLSFKTDENTPINLMGDDFRIRQILFNLIGNAIKFTNKGSISVTVGCNSNINRKGNICFNIVDTGIGISQSELKFLFQPFSQANSSITKNYGGTGLGLVICKKLVELLGGEIWLTSQEDVGTSIFFTLECSPICPGISTTKAVPPSNISDVDLPDSSPMNILLVDDSEDNRILVKAFLKNFRCKIIEATNGEMAVSLVKQKNFDIILMDLQMPLLDGYSATGQIRNWENLNKLPRTPIVALTAYALIEERQKSIAAGCDRHLTKPIKKSELLQVLQNYQLKPTSTEVNGVLSDPEI
jgi:signal transduction histidine kinase/ActR/RegA family two-component response regulator